MSAIGDRVDGLANPYVHRRASSAQAAARWTPRRALVVNLRAVIGRAYPRLIGARREPSWLFFEILLPLLTTCAFVLVYRSMHAPEAYVGFVVLGGAMTAFWLNVIWMMASQLYWEKDSGNLELYFTAPIDMMSILLGMALGGLAATVLRAGVVVVVGTLLFQVRFSVDQWLLLSAVFGLALVALYGLGMVLAGLFVMWGREAYHLTELLQEPVYFLGGMYAPLRSLGQLAGLVVATLPLAVGLDAMRQLAFVGPSSRGVLPAPAEAAILAAMCVVSIALARFALRRLELMARHEGRLTMRGR